MLFTRENIKLSPLNFQNYMKRGITPATRIVGEFEVETREGKLKCQDGYLAIDAEGYPYPIDKEIFLKTYVQLQMQTMPKKMPFKMPKQG